MYPTPPDSPDGPSDTEGARGERGSGPWDVSREHESQRRSGGEDAGCGESVDELGSAPESLLSVPLGYVATDQLLFVYSFFGVVFKRARVRNLIVA